MKIGILSFDLIRESGQSRFAINLSIGLKSLGVDVQIFSYSCDRTVEDELSKNGVRLHAVKRGIGFFDHYRSISDSKSVYLALLKLIKENDNCEYYIVLSDELIGISDFRTTDKWIYLSNGDMIFLFLNEKFLKEHSPFANVVSWRFVNKVIKHKKLVGKYDLLLGNSKFTANIMSFFLNSPFVDYVYPPVDNFKFRPLGENTDKKYALALLKSNSEPLAEYISEMTKSGKISIKIVGDAEIPGAQTLGRISDSELVKQYSLATMTITASFQEFFGYATAESLSCGTPVISFSHGGATELIEDGYNGWLVNSISELYAKTKSLICNEIPKEFRTNARISSDKYSIINSANKLLNTLRKLE